MISTQYSNIMLSQTFILNTINLKGKKLRKQKQNKQTKKKKKTKEKKNTGCSAVISCLICSLFPKTFWDST